MVDETGKRGGELVHAATVVLVREASVGVECLMLRKTPGQSFGGMWVFPGGKVEPADGVGPAGARRAAVREAREETGLVLDPGTLVPFSHWVPPTGTPRRFATWFFLAPLPEGASDVVIDGGEIGDQMWTTAAGALERHASGEVDLVPPTWMTLDWLAEAPTVDAALARAREAEVARFATLMVDDAGVLVALWAPDAGYESGDLAAPGRRHRLHMTPGGWTLERS